MSASSFETRQKHTRCKSIALDSFLAWCLATRGAGLAEPAVINPECHPAARIILQRALHSIQALKQGCQVSRLFPELQQKIQAGPDRDVVQNDVGELQVVQQATDLIS